MFENILRMQYNYEDRKVGRWNSEDGFKMVSTARVADGREPYETAVQHPKYNSGKMIIVECYSDKDAAIKGHAKWLKMTQEDTLPKTLVDCGNAVISQLIDAIGGTMAFERGN